MNLGRIDHTAIVVRNLDDALGRYERQFGLLPSGRSVAPEQQVEVAFLPIGDTQLELIQPTDEDSGVARFLARHGEGLHHIALTVDDLPAELDALDAAGVELIDRRPRRGVHGQIAFVHPRAMGVLIELVQHDNEGDGSGGS